jgi:nucleoside-diphosphate-sugar epimerase
MAHALLVAGRALLDGRPGSAGQIFFIKDFPPRNIFDLLEPIVNAAGGRMLPAALALPRRPVKALAWVLGLAARALRPIVRTTPLLTPFAVDSVCNAFTVETDKAERVLGYRPLYSEAEAYARTIAFVRRR